MDKAIGIIKREIAQRKLALTVHSLNEKEIQEELVSLEKVLLHVT